MRRYKMVIISVIILLLINNIMHSKVSYALDIANSKNQVLLSEIPNEEIYLYALDSDEGKSVYEDILLNVKGKKKRFNWIVDSGLSFRPELILTDINNDGKKELVIIITTGHGTGKNTQEVHIFKEETLEEIKVQNPFDIISKNVKTKVYKDENSVKVYININGKESVISSKKLNELYNDQNNKKNFGDTLFFRDFLIYEVYNEKLKAIVGGDIFFWNYLVNIKIEYKFESNMLVVDKIYFDVTEYFKD